MRPFLAVVLVVVCAGCDASPVANSGTPAPSETVTPGAVTPTAISTECLWPTDEPPCPANPHVEVIGYIGTDPVVVETAFVVVRDRTWPPDGEDDLAGAPEGVWEVEWAFVGSEPERWALEPTWMMGTWDGFDDEGNMTGGYFVNGEFEIELPSVSGATDLVVYYDSEVKYEVHVGGHAPVVTNVVYDAEAQTLSWDGTDADGDDLLFWVMSVDEEGASVVTMESPETEISLENSSHLGSGIQFQVFATDGLNAGWANTESVDLPDDPPEIFLWPDVNEVETNGEFSIVYDIDMMDWEDGNQFTTPPVWTSDIDGVLVEGTEFYLNGDTVIDGPTLTPGLHTITVTVTDSGGNTVEKSFTLLYDPDLEPDD